MEFREDIFDDPEEIEFFGDVVRHYRAAEPFEVDGIVYDPAEIGVHVRRPMIELISDYGF